MDEQALLAELTDEDRAILDLEGRTFRYVGAKEKRIRDLFGLTPTKYFVRLNRLIEQPGALIYAPAVVNRLRARRTSAQNHSRGESCEGSLRE